MVPPGGDVARTERLIDAELERIARDGPTTAELAKARNQALAGFWRGLETISGKAQALGSYEVFHGDYRKLFDAPGEYEGITAEDVRAAAADVLRADNRTFGVLEPPPAPAAAPPADARAMIRGAMLTCTSLLVACVAPAHAEDSASGGVRLPSLRAACARQRRRAGADGEARHTARLDAGRAARRLARRPAGEGGQRGAARRAAAEGCRASATRPPSPKRSRASAASSSPARRTESLAVGASFLARDVDLMVELVADALLRPRLDPGEFAKARTLAIQSIAAAKDGDPRDLIEIYGNAWLFRGHPYGRPTEGSEQSLDVDLASRICSSYYDAQLRRRSADRRASSAISAPSE